MTSTYNVSGRRLDFLDYLAILVFIVFAAATAFIFWQNMQANAENTKIVNETKSVDEQIDKLKKENLDKIALSQNFLKKVKDDEVVWSKVIDKISKLTPETVSYSSYIGTESKEVSIDVETYTVDKVIETIQAYTGTPDFGEVFVPSVDKGLASDAEELYSFTINTSIK